jgi:ubiquinone/menaquinone biosynthesis C-methylase UbiE
MKKILLLSIIAISAFTSCKMKIAKNQTVEIKDFETKGYILDIGGGGEGVIGQLKTNQVIAIDLYKRELESAPEGPFLKIVMDATDLKFLDNTLDAATIFYTMMYIPADKHEKVFLELYRTLKPGAMLRIWDVNLPTGVGNPKKTTIIYPFRFKLPSKTIRTAYGVRWAKNEVQNADYYIRLAEKAGFTTTKKVNQDPSFFLELQKYPLLPIP